MSQNIPSHSALHAPVTVFVTRTSDVASPPGWSGNASTVIHSLDLIWGALCRVAADFLNRRPGQSS